jgi:sister-chromatid-cohesion protein PDS5
MQARQPQFAQATRIFLQQCEAYNGGIIEAKEEQVKTGMSKTMQWFGAYFPDPMKLRADLQKFAKLNDRRSYQLIKYAIESESDFKTVRRAINELISKLQGSAASGSLDTLIPLMYRSSSLVYNRSHLATIMDYSKSDKDGFASAAHQILNDISQRNPDLFKAHSEQLQKDIIEQTPTENKANDPAVVDMLKAYSSYAKKYPDEVNCDRKFTQTLVDYALYGTPAKVAKYAVNILLAKNDNKSKVTATNLLQKTMKNCTVESPRLLNKLTTISQLERLVPTVVSDSDDAINDLVINKILRGVRTDAKASDPSWVNDMDMDDELQSKFLAMKILVNKALADESEDGAEDRVKVLMKLLRTFVVAEGEFCKVKDTPLHHKKRLRLLAGEMLLKLATVKKYDDQLDHATFNKLCELMQDSEANVRRHFGEKMQTYLTRGKLRARFYTIFFLVAFEPIADVKARVETWIRSRARYYAENHKQVMEAVTPRLISLLAHHPDYSAELNDLADFANYFLFYLSTVATEENISLIYKYAERVKQTKDGINAEKSENLYVLSDLAQTVIRNFQEKRNWSFQAYPGKVGLPAGLFAALPSSEVAQQIAKKLYVPEELDEKVGDLIRALDRKKKRKSLHDWSEQPAKKVRTQVKTVIRGKPESRSRPKSEKPSKKKATPRPKKTGSPLIPESERRRSGRSHAATTYKERDDVDDEAEMLDGVAEWDYGDDDSEPASGDDSSDAEEENEEAEDDSKEASAEDDESEPEEPARGSQQKASRAGAKGKTTTTTPSKPAVKASVLQSSRASRSSRARGGGRGASDMDMDNDDD